MKRIFVIWIAMVVTWTACEDALTLNPENSATFRNAYETESDMEAAVRLCAQKLREMNVILNENMGHLLDSIATTSTVQMRELDPQTIRQASWNIHYDLIGAANVVIKYADQINASQERKDYYRGQGYFYRAWTYFNMAQTWGDVVIVGLDADMELFRPKVPWTQVVDYAINDAREAVRLLPDYDKIKDSKGNSPQYKNEPCKGAANALLAYLCAWKAGGKYFARPEERDYDENALWEEAEAACTAIIGSETGAPSGVYQLAANPEEVCTSVLKGRSAESIFEAQYMSYWEEMDENFGIDSYSTSGDQRALPYHIWLMQVEIYGAGYDCIKKQNSLLKSETVLEMYPGNDLRRQSYFWKLDSMHLETGTSGGFAYPYAFRDFVVETAAGNQGVYRHFDCNYVFWRLADIYLLRAECRARLNKNDLAIADINVIRSRANAALYNASEDGGDVRRTVFKERERELLYEGHRYFDMIRNGYIRELSDGFAKATDQDFIDGCFFYAISPYLLDGRNTALRQNTWWNKYM